jgi:hypothetical protein
MRLPLFVSAQRPALHDPGPTPLREADVDDIEVLRNDRLRENRSRLPNDLGTEVAVRQVREREQTHAGGDRQLGGTGGRGVQGLIRALLFLDREGRLVDEDVRALGGLEDGPGRARVAGERDLPPRPRRAENLLGAHGAAAGKLDGLAALELPEEGAFRDAETLRLVQVETARPCVFD